MNSHKRQSSSSSFNSDQTHFQTSFSSLDNFMLTSKHMQDEIMVPSKLKDKTFEIEKLASESADDVDLSTDCAPTDALDRFRFIMLIRNQFLQTTPFKNIDEYKLKELKNKNFKTVFENISYHYNELMATLDLLSDESKTITDIYKENV